LLHGEPFDPSRHRAGTVVKGATYHQASLAAGPEGWQARVIVDV
jgi:SHS2 domain-containing protein